MKRLLLTGLALGLIGVGCGPPQIDGSLSTLIDLRYQKADLAVGGGQAALRFLTPQGAGQNVVLKVTCDLQGGALTAGTSVDLTKVLPNGQQAGVVTRNVLNDPLQSFPSLDRGTLVVQQTPVSGKSVTGFFSVTFSLGTDRSSGNTAYADFKATVL